MARPRVQRAAAGIASVALLVVAATLLTFGSRVDAHRFYEREGYHLGKIHHIMRKDFE